MTTKTRAQTNGKVEVNTETGELIDCPTCADAREAAQRAEVTIAGLEHEIRSLAYKLEEAKRDKDAEAREHDLWDRALDLHALWCAAAAEAEGKKKKRNKLNGERFWMVLPFLKGDGIEMCARAIVGRCFHHYSDQRPNGSTIYYNEWERIFGNKGKGCTARSNFEESVNRAPTDWRQRIARLAPDLDLEAKLSDG